MRNSRSHLYLLLLAAATATIAAAAGTNSSSTPSYELPYDPRDNILLDCGAPSGSENDNDHRTWYSDVDSRYSPSLTSPGPTTTFQDGVPVVPYLTARIFTSPFTYSFPLGAGRKYLRLHFYNSNYTSTSAPSPITQSLFSVTAGNITLLLNLSVGQTSAALNDAYLVLEYALNVSDAGLNLTFTPSSSSSFAFVNGIEIVSIPDLFSTASPSFVVGSASPSNYPIHKNTSKQTVFKLQNNSSPSLAGPNPSLLPQADVEPDKVLPAHKGKKKTGAIAGGVIGAVLLGCLLLFVWKKKTVKNVGGASDGPSRCLPVSVFKKSHTVASGKSNTASIALSLASNLCRHFSFAEIQSATNKFDESRLLGVGGFGKVYRGDIVGGSVKVAIKRGNPLSGQGINEFQTEIEMLSKLRHRHLVSLIGYCDEKNEMILVYNYMAYGTLKEHLYKTQNPPLSWQQRLEICIGAARGLHYLHTCTKYAIIHRDVKTTNILLDEKYVAKVSDFGLCKTGPELDHGHVTTVVKGTQGYLDPEYFRRRQLTSKSDVYSFGVVLFEVLCARPALNLTLDREQESLVEWALHCQKKGELDSIMDPFLKDKIAPECFKIFAETAVKCVAETGIQRPTMRKVLWNLEFALQLQESAEGETSLIIMGGKKEPHDPTMDANSSGTTTTPTNIGGQSSASEGSHGLTQGTVFSLITNLEGRAGWEVTPPVQARK